MSYLEYSVQRTPSGPSKILYLNWPLLVLVTAVAAIGFLMLFSVAGGDATAWSEPQMKRFAVGVGLMFFIAMVPVYFWRNVAGLGYIVALLLLVAVEFVGTEGKGAQRWIDLGFFRLQPSEVMKIAMVMILAAYYDWLDVKKISRPLWVVIPVLLILLPVFIVLRQPDLGTSMMLLIGGAIMMFLAGVHWAYFVAVAGMGGGLIAAVFEFRNTPYQFLADYQYRRIDVFLDPSSEPLGAGYHITQAKIAMGSGGWTGRGFMQGSQSRLNFLPEKHTDFIFNSLAEEFGFLGSVALLLLYVLIVVFCFITALSTRDRFGSLLVLGVTVTFFLFFAVNMSMVMGLVPVVGIPLPLVSYGGTAMLVLLIGFGLVQSVHIHRPRGRA